MLTKRQKQILEYVGNYIEKYDYAPSYDEIKKHLNLSSVSTIHFHIKTLEDRGFLRKLNNQPRSIDIYENELMIQIPLKGTISAGFPIEAIEDKETISVPKSRIPHQENLFGLRVIGDSMLDENINNNDIVLVKSQNTAENGQKVVALINNNEATLKKLFREEKNIRLQPANTAYSPIFVKPSNIIIQGVVVDTIKTLPNNEKLGISNDSFAQINIDYKDNKLNNWLNTIQCMDCVEGMRKLPDNSIDLVVTSPPYDEIRKYNGYSYDLHSTGKEIYRILKDGGIAVMVIQDQTKNFGKSLTSFRTIVDWVDNIGFKLFETVIYRKYGAEGAWWNKRFRVDHEYMPIFIKGERPQYFDKEPLKIPSKHGGKTLTGGGTRLTNGVRIATRSIKINPTKCRGTIWEYMTAGDGTRLKHEHPATFPNKIPYDFIQCFCPPKGIVLDPFVGSGTTPLAAIELERNYIGFDISKDYCDLSKKRIKIEGSKNKKLF